MSGPFKMKGWSPFTQKEFRLKSEKEGKGKYHYKKSQHPKLQEGEHPATELTIDNPRERINDLEDRIEFLNEKYSEYDRPLTKAEKAAMSKLKTALAKAKA